MSALPEPVSVFAEDFADVFYVQGVRLDHIHQSRLSGSSLVHVQFAIKRLLDIGVSGALLILFSPLILFCLLVTKFTSDGPVIFSQKRWGLHQCHFKCLKIRSMYVADDPRRMSVPATSAAGPGVLLKMKNDPRVTPAGRWMRKTSIDELPQLWNVLRGDMSIVGPRPLLLAMLDPFDAVRAARCAVRPGITGLWQIRNRIHNTHVSQMAVDDAEYIRDFSLWLDLRILWATPKEVLRGIGAH